MFRVFNTGSVQGAFINASYRGDVFKMNTIVKRGGELFDVNALDPFVHCDTGKPEPATALIIGARHGVSYSVDFLISKGADLNVQAPNDGNTALHEAARQGHVRVVVALVEAGADTSRVNKEGRTAAELAEANGYALVSSTINTPSCVTVGDIALYTRNHLPRQKSLNLKATGCWGSCSKLCLEC